MVALVLTRYSSGVIGSWKCLTYSSATSLGAFPISLALTPQSYSLPCSASSSADARAYRRSVSNKRPSTSKITWLIFSEADMVTYFSLAMCDLCVSKRGVNL